MHRDWRSQNQLVCTLKTIMVCQNSFQVLSFSVDSSFLLLFLLITIIGRPSGESILPVHLEQFNHFLNISFCNLDLTSWNLADL